MSQGVGDGAGQGAGPVGDAVEHNRMEAPSEPAANPEHGLPESFGEGLAGRVLF
jgi:hypothetical protein